MVIEASWSSSKVESSTIGVAIGILIDGGTQICTERERERERERDQISDFPLLLYYLKKERKLVFFFFFFFYSLFSSFLLGPTRLDRSGPCGLCRIWVLGPVKRKNINYRFCPQSLSLSLSLINMALQVELNR